MDEGEKASKNDEIVRPLCFTISGSSTNILFFVPLALGSAEIIWETASSSFD